MALVSVYGQHDWYPAVGPVNANTAMSSVLLIDATGEKVALSGQFRTQDGAPRTINTVGFPTGTVVSAGGSTIRVSLQNVTTTAGAPMQPDGVQDQYRDALLSTYTSDSWFTTGLITSDGTDGGTKRTVAHHELVSVVIEYSGARAGADSLIVKSAAHNYSASHGGAVATLYTASWARQDVVPCVVFGCSDGSVATLEFASPAKERVTTAYNSGSTPDEYALSLVAPFSFNADGLWTMMSFAAATGDCELVLTENGVEIEAILVDANTVAATGSMRILPALFTTARTITAGRTYEVSMRPTTASSVTIAQYDVQSAGYWACAGGPTAAQQAERTNGGAWTYTTTRRPVCGFIVSARHDGSGGIYGAKAGGDMLQILRDANGYVIVRVKLYDSSSTTSAGLAGLTNASAGLIISTIASNEATPTAYTAGGSTIETIATLGTYAAPTATKCRFKQVDATNHPGVYEIQFAEARLGVAGATSLAVSISGATNLQQRDFIIPRN